MHCWIKIYLISISYLTPETDKPTVSTTATYSSMLVKIVTASALRIQPPRRIHCVRETIFTNLKMANNQNHCKTPHRYGRLAHLVWPPPKQAANRRCAVRASHSKSRRLRSKKALASTKVTNIPIEALNQIQKVNTMTVGTYWVHTINLGTY